MFSEQLLYPFEYKRNLVLEDFYYSCRTEDLQAEGKPLLHVMESLRARGLCDSAINLIFLFDWES